MDDGQPHEATQSNPAAPRRGVSRDVARSEAPLIPMTMRPMPKCLRCGQTLRGLPVVGQCGQCGVRYELGDVLTSAAEQGGRKRHGCFTFGFGCMAVVGGLIVSLLVINVVVALVRVIF